MNADTGEKPFSPVNSFYYLAPVWFLAETFLWPNFRAGVIFGGSTAGAAAFYAAEWGIGFALWRRLRYADLTALLENIAYLVFAFKYVLFAPFDAAAALGADISGSEGNRDKSFILPKPAPAA